MINETAWTTTAKQSTGWTETAKQSTGWSGNINATTSYLVDDPVALVDDTVCFVNGYDSVTYPFETIKNTPWS